MRKRIRSHRGVGSSASVHDWAGADGNLEFARQLGLTTFHRGMFLGERSKRYLLVVHDGLIQKLRVEREMMDYTCTRADDVLLIDA